jgi:hypothetical protein
MASRSPPPSKRGRREDGDDESRRHKKLEKGKESAAKDADEEPLFDDNKFAAELLRSAFRKLERCWRGLRHQGASYDAHKDPTLKGHAFRIHELAEKLENLPVVKRAARRHFFFDDDGSDGDDGSHDNDGCDDDSQGGNGGLRLIDRLLYQLVTIMPVCFCIFVRFLDMNCLVCLSIMNCLVK